MNLYKNQDSNQLHQYQMVILATRTTRDFLEEDGKYFTIKLKTNFGAKFMFIEVQIITRKESIDCLEVLQLCFL